MRINIISYESINDWICGKIAFKLHESLKSLGADAQLSNCYDNTADINHHIIYTGYQLQRDSINTLCITHIDNHIKFQNVKDAVESASLGICMSAETMHYLSNMGIPQEKLTYLNMAHDSNSIQRKFRIGITTRLYPDGRKNENYLEKVAEVISPSNFEFVIMGYGWRQIVESLCKKGFEVEYHQDFDYLQYKTLLSKLDYYLYMGADEGSAGFIDALAAGVKTIVQPQGFHLDAKNGITHAFTSLKELKQIFKKIELEKTILTDSVSSWTWINYARLHLDLWNSLMNDEVGVEKNLAIKKTKKHLFWRKMLLRFNWLRQRIKLIGNLGKEYQTASRFFKKK